MNSEYNLVTQWMLMSEAESCNLGKQLIYMAFQWPRSTLLGEEKKELVIKLFLK